MPDIPYKVQEIVAHRCSTASQKRSAVNGQLGVWCGSKDKRCKAELTFIYLANFPYHAGGRMCVCVCGEGAGNNSNPATPFSALHTHRDKSRVSDGTVRCW